ncbi:tetratricopeptide repeat protein [Sphingomonas sp.]|uniref:tetratricopeptide repeat protein n=1 Tax=Sphingomonas sp. TaxID=28214 RepID=UPI003AFFCA12
MIALALLLAAAAPVPAERARYDACVAKSDADAKAAIADARAWAGSGGGVAAGQCLGIAQSAAGDDAAAADSFAATAELAGQTGDARAPTLWVSAGNAALAAGDAARAKRLLGQAIESSALAGQMRGEAFLDRARANVALAALAEARADMDEALKLVPADPMAWLLSATLARRMGDARAATDIHEADVRAPNEPAILYEAGNIAAAHDDMVGARENWARARAVGPDSDAGRAATAELARSGGIPPAPQPQGR